MTRSEYLRAANEAFNSGRVDEDTYSAVIENMDIFCEDEDDYEDDERFPEGYAEIEYDGMDTAEAQLGSRFDDMNFLRYFER